MRTGEDRIVFGAPRYAVPAEAFALPCWGKGRAKASASNTENVTAAPKMKIAIGAGWFVAPWTHRNRCHRR